MVSCETLVCVDSMYKCVYTCTPGQLLVCSCVCAPGYGVFSYAENYVDF